MLTMLMVVAALNAADSSATRLMSLPSRPTTEPAAPAEPAPPPPAAVDTVRGLLAAHHTADLPKRETLDHTTGAQEALVWLANWSDSLVEAERAAMLLGLYTDDGTTASCIALLQSTTHAKVRAGAARCLSGRTLATPVLTSVLADSDIRVGIAAAESIRATPGAVAALDPSMVDVLPAEVRAQLRAP